MASSGSLTISEIRGKIFATIDGTEEGLVTYWQFNDGSGSYSIDVAGSYTGTLINMLRSMRIKRSSASG